MAFYIMDVSWIVLDVSYVFFQLILYIFLPNVRFELLSIRERANKTETANDWE